MDGGPNRVPERPKWLIWTIWSYYIYRECVLSENESARAKIFTNAPRESNGRYASIGVSTVNGVETVVSTLLRGRGVNVCAL